MAGLPAWTDHGACGPDTAPRAASRSPGPGVGRVEEAPRRSRAACPAPPADHDTGRVGCTSAVSLRPGCRRNHFSAVSAVVIDSTSGHRPAREACVISRRTLTGTPSGTLGESSARLPYCVARNRPGGRRLICAVVRWTPRHGGIRANTPTTSSGRQPSHARPVPVARHTRARSAPRWTVDPESSHAHCACRKPGVIQ